MQLLIPVCISITPRTSPHNYKSTRALLVIRLKQIEPANFRIHPKASDLTYTSPLEQSCASATKENHLYVFTQYTVLTIHPRLSTPVTTHCSIGANKQLNQAAVNTARRPNQDPRISRVVKNPETLDLEATRRLLSSCPQK